MCILLKCGAAQLGLQDLIGCISGNSQYAHTYVIPYMRFAAVFGQHKAIITCF